MTKKLALPVVVMFLLAFAVGCEKADEKSFGEFEATANSLTGKVTDVELTPGEIISTSGTYGDAAAGTDSTTEPVDADDEKDAKDEDGDDDDSAPASTTTTPSVDSTDKTTGTTSVVGSGSAQTESVPDLLGGKDTVTAGAATKETTSDVDLLGVKDQGKDGDKDDEDAKDDEAAAEAALEAKELEVKQRANQVIDAMAQAGFKREDGRPDLKKILDKMADYLDEHDGNVTVAQFVEDMTGSKAFRDLPTKLELIVDKVRGDQRTYFERDADETEEK